MKLVVTIQNVKRSINITQKMLSITRFLVLGLVYILLPVEYTTQNNFTEVLQSLKFKCVSSGYNYHLLTETEGNSVFCGPETVDVETSTVEGPQNTLLSRGLSQ